MALDIATFFPFSDVGDEDCVLLRGSSWQEIAGILTKIQPVPDPNFYDVNYFDDGVHFTLNCDNSSSSSSATPKTAIMPYRNPETGEDEYIAWNGIESPEVIFEDVWTVPINASGVSPDIQIPAEFIAGCEMETFKVKSIQAVGFPARVTTGIVKDTGKLRFRTHESGDNLRRILRRKPKPRDCRELIVTVMATRKGFKGVRWEKKTEAEFKQNEAFYRSAHHSPDN